MKTCVICLVDKLEEDFSVAYGTYRRPQCNVCRSRVRRDKSPRKDRIPRTVEQIRKADYLYNLRTKYNLSEPDLNALLAAVEGKCEICRTNLDGLFLPTGYEGGGNTLCIDHCHTSGKFRGLLCRRCNSGIGQLRDCADLCEKATKYLKRDKIPHSYEEPIASTG